MRSASSWKYVAGGAAAAGAAGDLRHEAANAEGLEDLLGAARLLRSGRRRGVGSERDADGVAYAGEEERGLRPAVEATTPFMPIPASVRPRCRAWSVRRGKLGVNVDEISYSRDLRRLRMIWSRRRP